MERDQKATVILAAIDKQAPVDVDWNKSKAWMAAIMRGLRDVEQVEAEERHAGNLYGMQESVWKEFCLPGSRRGHGSAVSDCADGYRSCR